MQLGMSTVACFNRGQGKVKLLTTGRSVGERGKTQGPKGYTGRKRAGQVRPLVKEFDDREKKRGGRDKAGTYSKVPQDVEEGEGVHGQAGLLHEAKGDDTGQDEEDASACKAHVAVDDLRVLCSQATISRQPG